MIEKLREIVQNSHGNSYKSNIKKDIDLYNWLIEQTSFLSENCKLIERAYCVLNNITNNICPLGNKKSFDRMTVGYRFCGIQCECMRQNQKNINANRTEEEKQIISINKSKGRDNISEEEKELSKKKREDTCEQKYGKGIKFASQAQAVKDKKEETCLRNWGYKTNLLNPEQQKLIESILLERYGVSHTWEIPGIQDRKQQTNLRKYNAKTAMANTEFREASYQRSAEQNNGLKRVWKKYYNQEQLSFLTDKNLFENEFLFLSLGILECQRKYSLNRGVLLKRIELWNIPFEEKMTSIEEFVAKFLNKNNINFSFRNKKIIKPYELDFYIEDYKLAIEVHGL